MSTLRLRKEERGFASTNTVTGETLGRLMRRLPRRPGVDPGGRNPILRPCPAHCGGHFGVAAMINHLAHDCPMNKGEGRITQAAWRKMNRQRIKREQRLAAEGVPVKRLPTERPAGGA